MRGHNLVQAKDQSRFDARKCQFSHRITNERNYLLIIYLLVMF